MRRFLDPTLGWYPESASMGRRFLDPTLEWGPESATMESQFLGTRWQTFGLHPGDTLPPDCWKEPEGEPVHVFIPLDPL